MLKTKQKNHPILPGGQAIGDMSV